MAELARTLGPTGYEIAVENRSISTWENVLLALPMAERYETVMFASDPIHCARARAYAHRQRPDLTGRIASADDYRLLERWWLKVPTVAYELWGRARHQITRWP
jgi:uncharacterized SAM-binding protein YcdF (DUF218 family)